MSKFAVILAIANIPAMSAGSPGPTPVNSTTVKVHNNNSATVDLSLAVIPIFVAVCDNKSATVDLSLADISETMDLAELKPHLDVYSSELRASTVASISGAYEYIDQRLTGDWSSSCSRPTRRRPSGSSLR